MIDKLEKKLDTTTFAKKVEEIVRDHSMDYMEAILFFCEENGIEVEAIASLVKRSEPIRQKLEAQCISSRMLGRSRAGPVANLDAFQETP